MFVSFSDVKIQSKKPLPKKSFAKPEPKRLEPIATDDGSLDVISNPEAVSNAGVLPDDVASSKPDEAMSNAGGLPDGVTSSTDANNENDLKSFFTPKGNTTEPFFGEAKTSTAESPTNVRSQAFKPTADIERLRRERLDNTESRRNKKREKRLLQLRMNNATADNNGDNSSMDGSVEDQKQIAGLANSIEKQIDELSNDILNKINEGNTTLKEVK